MEHDHHHQKEAPACTTCEVGGGPIRLGKKTAIWLSIITVLQILIVAMLFNWFL